MERSEKLKGCFFIQFHFEPYVVKIYISEMLTIKSNMSPKIEKHFKTHRIETSGSKKCTLTFL